MALATALTKQMFRQPYMSARTLDLGQERLLIFNVCLYNLLFVRCMCIVIYIVFVFLYLMSLINLVEKIIIHGYTKICIQQYTILLLFLY